ncbi:MAG: outer membrane lipoprotein-sorting protein [bacterium]
MRRPLSYLLLSFLVLGLVSQPLLAADDSPNTKDLVWKSYRAAYFQGDDAKARVTMEITNNKGQTRTRKLSLLRMDIDDKNQKYYSYFHEPPRLRDMVFMVWTHANEQDDRWLYLPSIDVVQRITGSQKRNSFAGSDFTYEDMTGRYPANDTFEYLGEDSYQGNQVHVIEGKPKNPDLVEFSRYEVKIDKETYLPWIAVFYTPQGEKHRTLTLEEVKTIQGYKTPVVQKAIDHQTGSTSVATMEEVKYDIGLPERVFEKRYLRRPPTPWIKP